MRVGAAVTILALTALTLEAVPYLYPAICGGEQQLSMLDIFRYEHETGMIGVDPAGSYFPKTVGIRPNASPLEADYAAGINPQRFDMSVLPVGATADVDYRPNAATITLSTAEPFTARYLQFDFPGWQATLNGEPLAITPSDPEGFITVAIPAGDYTLELWFGSTPRRQLLNAVSLFALLGVVGLVWVGRNNQLPQDSHRLRRHEDHERGSIGQLIGSARANGVVSDVTLLLLAIILLCTILFGFHRLNTPLRRVEPLKPDVAIKLRAAELELVGYNLSADRAFNSNYYGVASVASGESFDVDLAWHTLAPPATRYQSNIWIEDFNGVRWSNKETFRPRLYEEAPETQWWQPGQWAWDSREVEVLPGTPPGQYRIKMTTFVFETLEPIPMVNERGETKAEWDIGQIQVTESQRAPTIAPQQTIDNATIADSRTLFGFDLDRTEANVGDPFLLTFYWQVENNIAEPTSLVALRDAQGEIVQTWRIQHRTPNGEYPTRGQHVNRFSAELNSGTYQLEVDDVPLAPVTLNAPERITDRAAFDLQNAILLEKEFINGIMLSELSAENGQVALVWRTSSLLPVSYRVFIHVLDANGALIAQSDGEPGAWQRPTTSWSRNELILDTHILNHPLNDVTIRVGLYDPDTGQRLLLAEPDGDGQDFVELYVE